MITKENRPTRLGITVFLSFILVSALFLGFDLNLKHVSGFSPLQAAVANTASTASQAVAVNTNPINKNDYLIVMITTQNGGTISSVKDTLENTFSSVISQTNTELAAIYIAQNTNKTADDTVTVAFSVAQANVTVGVAEMQQINSLTASVTGSGHGTGGVVTKLSAAIQPNLGDACFSTGIGATNTGGAILISNVPAVGGNLIDTGFGSLFEVRSSSTAGISFGAFDDYPNATQKTLATMVAQNINNKATITLGTWEEVAACFPQNQVTTTTTTTTTSSITSNISNAVQENYYPVFALGFFLIIFVFIVAFVRRK